MKVQVNMEYWADVYDGEQVSQQHLTVPVWIESRDLPDGPPPAIAVKTGDMSYKKMIRFQRQPESETEVAVGCWTSGEPGKLYADKAVVDEEQHP